MNLQLPRFFFVFPLSLRRLFQSSSDFVSSARPLTFFPTSIFHCTYC
jgi:hypothetical protein